jgi:hypothetical protein
MRSLDTSRLTDQIAPLTRFFYAMLAVTLLAVLFGSPSSALFFLVVAAMSQVVRAAIQELAWERERPAATPRPGPRVSPGESRSASRPPRPTRSRSLHQPSPRTI